MIMFWDNDIDRMIDEAIDEMEKNQNNNKGDIEQ